MNVGDLVEVISEWTHYNKWLVFDTKQPIGLLTKFETPKMVRVLIGGEERIHKTTELRVLEKK